MQKTVILDGREYIYEFERKRIRNINLRIRADGSIYVSCPKSVSDRVVNKFILSKKDFIISSLNKVNSRLRNTRQVKTIAPGTRVSVIGINKEIVLIPSKRNHVEETDGNVVIYAKDIYDQDLLLKVYNKWRAEALKAKVLRICDEVCPLFVNMGADEPSVIKFRTMKSRWGSCKPKERVITFNYNLFEVPEDCIRYVVVHEFAHLLVPDHSERFYRYVARVMPDWKVQRRLLNEY